ncbi:hypothetical protein [Desulfonatronum thiosulfatophilum]|uniref:hypothetical protein n=1 Tax=Desulfonatronum thiosulfatophilum TaxID=617002 RepID=UPI0011142829|nr:hypothetical protein [Desulfonatronum thiosulfatophilum]
MAKLGYELWIMDCIHQVSSVIQKAAEPRPELSARLNEPYEKGSELTRAVRLIISLGHAPT